MKDLPLKIIKNTPITLPEAKETLEKLDKELNQFQKKTLDYITNFSKIDKESAEKLKETLVSKIGLEPKEVVQIINCMPESIEELRVFFPRHKAIETEKLQEVLKHLDEYR